MLGINDTSTLVGHFVLSSIEREKRDRRISRRDEWEGQGKERDREERGTGVKVKKQMKLKHSPSTLTCYKDSRPCPTVSQYQVDTPVMGATQDLRTTQPPRQALWQTIHLESISEQVDYNWQTINYNRRYCHNHYHHWVHRSTQYSISQWCHKLILLNRWKRSFSTPANFTRQ